MSVVRNALWLTHKPAGEPSFDMVARSTAELDVKACHGGALDPFATGLLIVLMGQATRVFHLLHSLPKTYEATIRWGEETDNLDLTGKVVARGDLTGLNEPALEQALQAMLGWQEQVPPAYSNKRVGGERAWRKAQRGEAVELAPARVYLHDARWVSHDLAAQHSRLTLTCRGGYYVRSLARDLGVALGARAHLTALHRTRIGPFAVPPLGEKTVVPLDDALTWCPTRTLSDAEMGELRQQLKLPPSQVMAATWELPDGFPNPDAPLVVKHLGHVVALLDDTGALLAWLTQPPRQR